MAEQSKRKLKTVMERNKFFDTTNIAGFGLIQRSDSRLEISIWYIVILFFCFLTVRSIYILTNEYVYQEPIITVKLEKWNANISDFYIKMDIILPELYDEFYDKNHFPYPFPYPYNRSLSADLDKALAEMNTREKVINEKVNWPYFLLPLMSRFTFMMEKLEFPNYGNIENMESLTKKLRIENVFPLIEKFLVHCDGLNVTQAEIINKWFDEVMKLIFKRKTRFSMYWSNVHLMGFSFRRWKDTRVSHIGFRLKNKVLRNSEHWIVSYRDIIKILLDSGVFGQNFTTDQAVEWYMEKLDSENRRVLVYRDYLVAHAGNHYNFKPLMQIEFGQNVEREAKAVYSFRSVSDKCNKTTPKWKCYGECMAKFVLDKCGCSLRLFPQDFGDNTTQSCSMETYIKSARPQRLFHQERDRSKEDEYCQSSCLDYCNQDILSFNREFKSEKTANDTLELALKPSFVKHPVFQEIYAQSSTGFWADLGGAFDFWIGASVISAVHLIVYIVKQLIYAFKSKTKTGQNMRHLMQGFRSTGDQVTALLTLGMTQQPFQLDNTSDESRIEKLTGATELMQDIIEKQQEKIENLERGAQEQQVKIETTENTTEQQKQEIQSLQLDIQKHQLEIELLKQNVQQLLPRNAQR